MNVGLILNSKADENGDDHEDGLRAVVRARGANVAAVYRADGFHRAPHRSMRALIGDAKEKDLDAVVIWGLECISRSSLRKTLDCIQMLIDSRIGIISIREPHIDTTIDNGSVALNVFSALASYDSHRISRRTREALARAKAAGRILGRPKGSKDTSPRVVRRRGRQRRGA